MTRKLPYLFLFSLIVILTFILGVKYGKKVEQANKINSYLLKITPSASPKPSEGGSISLAPTKVSTPSATVSPKPTKTQ